MAGDWLPIRFDLHEDPGTIGIARSVRLDEFSVVGRLIRLWSWASSHTQDGLIPFVTPEDIDKVAQRAGFAKAMSDVSWLEILPGGGIKIPNFDRWMGNSAKRRLQDAKRKKSEYANRRRDGPYDFSANSPQENGDSLLSSPVLSALEEEGGLGEGETALAESARWLAREWVAHLRRSKHMVRCDKAEDISPQMFELLRTGSKSEDLHAEIVRKARLKDEHFWEFRKRILEGRKASPDDFVDKLNEARARRDEREAKANGRIR